MDGSQKVPMAIIGKSQCPRAFNGKLNQLRLNYFSQKNAWMDKIVFMKWLKEVFHPFVQKLYGDDEEILLLLDNAPPHLGLSEFSFSFKI